MGHKALGGLQGGPTPTITGVYPGSASWTALPGMVGFFALLGAFFLLPLNGLERIGGLPIGDLFLLVAALAAAAACLLERRLPPVPIWLAIGVVLLTLGFLASEFLSGVEPGDLSFLFKEPRTSAAGLFVRLLLAAFVLPVVASVLAPGWSPIRLLVIAWIAGVTLSCFIAWLDAALGIGIQAPVSAQPERVTFHTEQASVRRSFGLTNHPNSLALSAVLVLPLVTAFIRDQKSFLRLLPVLGLLSAGVLLSGSRTGLVALVLALSGSLALVRPFRATIVAPGKREAMVRALAVAITALVLLGALIPQQGSPGLSGAERLKPGDRSASEANVNRSRILSDSLVLIEERPLTGSGFQLIEYSHNVYIQPLVAGGLLAFLGLMLVLGGFLREGFRLYRAETTASNPIAAGLLLSLLLYLISALLLNQIADRYVFLGMALILSASVAKGLPGPIPPSLLVIRSEGNLDQAGILLCRSTRE